LVKSASRAASVSTGSSSSRPTSDQVPEETYADGSSPLGTATTADAVSWDPTATTGTSSPRPTACATSGSKVPITDPGDRSGGRIPAGTPTRSATSAAQSPVRTSYSPVVEAFVRSAPSSPVSQKPSRSGSSSIVDACSSAGVPAAETSW
jgi:hypothetical protein